MILRSITVRSITAIIYSYLVFCALSFVAPVPLYAAEVEGLSHDEVGAKAGISAEAGLKPKVKAKVETDKSAIRFPKSQFAPIFFQLVERGPKYLSRDLEIDIPPPPANDSAETAQELAQLKAYAATARDDETYRLILTENRENLWDTFEREGLYPVAPSPAGRALTRDALFEATYFFAREKLHYLRARPSQLAPDLSLVIENPPHAAYPSGHASQGYIIALVLSHLDPSRADEYLNLARDIARRREIAGVHYPSDSSAGIALAQQVFDNLMKNDVFLDKIQKIAAELEKLSENDE